MSSPRDKAPRKHTFKKTQKQKRSGEDVIDAVPLWYKSPNSDTIHQGYPKAPRKHTFKKTQKQKRSGEDVIDAVPLRYKSPNSNTIHQGDPEVLIKDRKAGWIQEERQRLNGHIDRSYHHLKYEEECRSLLEVYDFIRLGVPKRLRKELNPNEGKAPPQEKRSGTSLLKKQIIGTYNDQTKRVSLHADGEHQEVDSIATASTHNEAEALQGEQHVYPYITFEFL